MAQVNIFPILYYMEDGKNVKLNFKKCLINYFHSSNYQRYKYFDYSKLFKMENNAVILL